MYFAFKLLVLSIINYSELEIKKNKRYLFSAIVASVIFPVIIYYFDIFVIPTGQENQFSTFSPISTIPLSLVISSFILSLSMGRRATLKINGKPIKIALVFGKDDEDSTNSLTNFIIWVCLLILALDTIRTFNFGDLLLQATLIFSFQTLFSLILVIIKNLKDKGN